MTIRPRSARVSSSRNGRKTSLSQGAVLTVSQPNTFNRQQLFTTTPAIARVGNYIYSYDRDNLELTVPSMQVGESIESLPVEVVQVYDRNGSLSSFNVQFVHDGRVYEYDANAFTNNLPYGVRLSGNVFRQFQDKYMTHNHPNGSSFSLDDFSFSVRARLAGIEAIPKRREFWGAVRELDRNQRQLLNDLEVIRRTNYNNGLRSDAMVVERMMQFVMQTRPNPSEPQVRFQATPLSSRGWSTQIRDNEWYKGAMINLITDLSSLRYLSENTRYLLLSHALNESFADRMGFRYSMSGI